MQGKTLRLYLRSNDITVEEATKKLGITRQTLRNWFNQEFLAEYIFEKLKKLGVRKNDLIAPPPKIDIEIDRLTKEVDLLKTLIESKNTEIGLLRELVDALKKK